MYRGFLPSCLVLAFSIVGGVSMELLPNDMCRMVIGRTATGAYYIECTPEHCADCSINDINGDCNLKPSQGGGMTMFACRCEFAPPTPPGTMCSSTIGFPAPPAPPILDCFSSCACEPAATVCQQVLIFPPGFPSLPQQYCDCR